MVFFLVMTQLYAPIRPDIKVSGQTGCTLSTWLDFVSMLERARIKPVNMC